MKKGSWVAADFDVAGVEPRSGGHYGRRFFNFMVDGAAGYRLPERENYSLGRLLLSLSSLLSSLSSLVKFLVAIGRLK